MADALMALLVIVSIVVLAPVFYRFIGMVSESADPFSALLMQLFLPLLVIALMLSVGISARRRV